MSKQVYKYLIHVGKILWEKFCLKELHWLVVQVKKESGKAAGLIKLKWNSVGVRIIQELPPIQVKLSPYLTQNLGSNKLACLQFSGIYTLLTLFRGKIIVGVVGLNTNITTEMMTLLHTHV